MDASDPCLDPRRVSQPARRRVRPIVPNASANRRARGRHRRHAASRHRAAPRGHPVARADWQPIEDILRSGALDLADFLNRRMNGVYVNDVQGNPFQPDVNYRGYTASPLLGTPQGLSVFMDGVRLNQPFGEVVSWDLIPRLAIASTILMPGSNPLFGLNTLGGAIAIQTKSGRTNPGTTAEATVRQREATDGDVRERRRAPRRHRLVPHGQPVRRRRMARALAVGRPAVVRQGRLAERENRPQRVRCVREHLADGQRPAGFSLSRPELLERLHIAGYDRQPVVPLQRRGTKRSPRNGLLYSGNAYYRNIHTDTFNGDINEDSLDQSLYQPNAAERAALAAAGYTGFPTSGENASNTPFPFWRCIGNALLRDEPAEKCNGLLNSTGTVQHNAGVSGQVTLIGKGACRPPVHSWRGARRERRDVSARARSSAI